MAKVLGLDVQETSTFRVYIETSNFLICRFYCPQVALIMQDHVFHIDLYVLPIEGPDVVFGSQWLGFLGKVSHDYTALTMEFSWNGSHVLLSGEFFLSPRKISFNQLQGLMSHDHIHGLFKLCLLQNDPYE